MDNATAEYSFVSNFFSQTSPLFTEDNLSATLSPTVLLSPAQDSFNDARSNADSDVLTPRNNRVVSSSSIGSLRFSSSTAAFNTAKQEQAILDNIWKQIFDPVLEYCHVRGPPFYLQVRFFFNVNFQTFIRAALEPMPPVITLLIMIRLTEVVVAEVQQRNCPAVETFVYTVRLQMWPVFQKAMAEHIEALKKLAEGTATGYFSRSSATSDTLVTEARLLLLLP